VQRDEAIARRDALAAENERLHAALCAAKDEVARLREELRVVSRYAARLYDAAEAVVSRIDEGAGAIWHAALKRGREGK
jgi:predicted nuclease with TOPRIM domain